VNTTAKRKELRKSGVKLPVRVVERQIKKSIIPWMERDEIIVITGARQTGKSVLLYTLICDYLLPMTTNIFYFNLDIPGQRNFVEKLENIVDLTVRHKGKVYLLIDEVQRLKEPGLYLKGLYDLHLPVKIIVSGSSTLEIKSKVQEALTGRKIVFHVMPFNLKELASAIYPGRDTKDIFKDEKSYAKVLYNYLAYGGYPSVALAKKPEVKLRLLEEIFRSYMEKDVRSFLKIENENAFGNLVRILASQAGNLVNKHELSNTLGIHKNTLENYLFYLEQTFIIDFVRPFHTNPRKELIKSPKIFFHDLGLRNFALGSFGDFDFRPDKGAVFENFIYLCLKEKAEAFDRLNFWRTKTGAEVDFVLVRGLHLLPFEVKASRLKAAKTSKSLRNFIRSYQVRKGYCVNLSFEGSQKIEDAEISFLTPVRLMEEKFE
jgi:uncharacterized protein